MRLTTSIVLLLGLAGASVQGCGGDRSGWEGFEGPTGGGAAGTGAAGTSGAAGTTGVAGTGLMGTSVAGAAMEPPGGVKAEPTPGCGTAPGQQPGPLVGYTLQTMGSKAAGCADSQCGAWSYAREYFLHLPVGYDGHQAYPLVIEGPGCGAKGNNLYRNTALDAVAIRVGLTPSADAQAIHATNPNQGCFDDRDGDDSVDWAFYEALYDKLTAELCFDRNRVFAAGISSGARLANELGCKYAGDALRPIRGVMSTGAALPPQPMQRPTCNSKPMAGLWVHGVDSPTTPFTESQQALERAMRVNGCTMGTTYETAAYEPFRVGSDYTTCKRVKGCPAEFPLVICPSPVDRGSYDYIVNPGWVAMLKLLEATP